MTTALLFADCDNLASVAEMHGKETDQMKPKQMSAAIRNWCKELAKLPVDQQVAVLNDARQQMHDAGPFRREPVDCVLWVKGDEVYANDYNPNSVAPPEMELLRLSIQEDGYTQPIVSWLNEAFFEVVDGFHRNRVGRECPDVTERIHGYLPLTVVNNERTDRGDRIASTIRHNRARGKHAVVAMSDIVIELKRRNWSDTKIGKHLGMDPDEVLRLSQISGLAEMFQDRQFSEAWEAADPLAINENDNLEVDDEMDK
jgi:ParB-like chromosome segregation protein Spo0J